MKKRMTISEFSEYCQSHRPNKISYCIQEQGWYCANLAKRERAVYDAIRIYESLGIVSFSHGADHFVSIAPVQFVDLETRKHGSETVAKIACGDEWFERKTYTFVLS